MRIDRLTIGNCKNLRELTIDFDEEYPTTVILGRNGTGKSNLLEALIIIFRDLDLGEPPAFKYQITYLCREYEVSIDADPERPRKDQVRIKVDGIDVTYQHFAKETERRYLPSYV